MNKKYFLFLTIFLFSAAGLFSFGSQEKKPDPAPEQESREERLVRLEKMEKLWMERNIKSYSARISYARAAMPREVLTLRVTNGAVTEWSSESAREYSPEPPDSLTVESLLRRLRDSLEAAGSSPMELRAVYDTEYGYVKKLFRVPSGDPSRTGRPPLDAGYSIEYLEFSALQ
jgi:hypothetical protein